MPRRTIELTVERGELGIDKFTRFAPCYIDNPLPKTSKCRSCGRPVKYIAYGGDSKVPTRHCGIGAEDDCAECELELLHAWAATATYIKVTWKEKW